MKNKQIKEIVFKDREGNLASGNHAIFPIFKNVRNELKLYGTGFFIGPCGLFATAKHVVMDRDLPQNNLHVFHFYGNNQYLTRPIKQISIHPKADVAIGLLSSAKNNKTGKEIKNKSLTLTFRTPSINSVTTTFAYPQDTFTNKNNKIELNDYWSQGKIIEHHPNGRDSVFLPEECYRTDIKILHCASGGPAMDDNGKVFGINSTAYTGTGDSYISSIRSILDLAVPSSLIFEGINNPTIRILKEKGIIQIE